MGYEKNSSSESDEEDNTRHDRFKSERFQDSNSIRHNTSHIKVRERNYSKHSSKSYRERSPLRSHLEKRGTSRRRESRHRQDDISDCSKTKTRHRQDDTGDCPKSRHRQDDIGDCSKLKQRQDDMGDCPKSRHRQDDISDCSKSRKHNVRCQSPIQTGRKNIEHHDTREKVEPNLSKVSSKKLSSILMNFDKKIESKRLNSESHHQIGPALPPHLAQKIEERDELNLVNPMNNASIGPALPPHLNSSSENADKDKSGNDPCAVETEFKSSSSGSIDRLSDFDVLSSMGPALPPQIQNQQSENVDDLGSDEESQKGNVEKETPICPANEVDEKVDLYGPMLPPKLEQDSYGPALPPSFKKTCIQGPILPSGLTPDDLERMGQESSEDEDTFGPLPVGKMNMTQYQLDLRALDIKRKLEEEKGGSSKDIKKREEWMLELPPEKASNLGLGPRSFRMKEGPDMSNRSSWTDTPIEKKRKEEMALRGEVAPVSSEEVMRTAFVKERNETMEKISKLNRDESRQESLLEKHQKKLKKKKKKEEKEGKKKERRPFDRNIDLQVHRFDEAQKKAIFKKAQLLDTRFSSGESKFL